MPIPKDPLKAQLWKERQRAAQRPGISRNAGATNPFFGKHHTPDTLRRISEAISGERNGLFGTHRPQYVKDAIGNAHRGVAPWMKGKHHSDETKRKLSEAKKGRPSKRRGAKLTDAQRLNISNGTKLHTPRGPANPRWKGGISPATQRARYSFEMNEWRRKVFERDHFICQHCGYPRGKILIAHHVKPFAHYPALRFEIDNGITLCKACHNAAHPR